MVCRLVTFQLESVTDRLTCLPEIYLVYLSLARYEDEDTS